MTPEEKAIELLVKDLEKIEDSMLKRIVALVKSGNFTDADIASLSGQVDFFQQINQLGYAGKLEKFFEQYDEILKKINQEAISRGLQGLSGASARTLDNYVNLKAGELLGKAQNFGNELQSALMSNLIAGTPIKDLVATLKETITPLSGNQLKVALNAGVKEFRVLTTKKVYEDLPEQRFKLYGPVDEKIRPSCHGVMKYQPKEGYTKKEIDEGAWTKLAIQGAHEFSNNAKGEIIPSSYNMMDGKEYTFLFTGGFGPCRHEPLAIYKEN